jgi:NAD(P)H-hydrate epimerase
LFGVSDNSLTRYKLAQEAARQYKCIIILKGANTHIFSTDGKVYINSTGNPGMATAGSGDVLTGIISALIAQQYNPVEAAVLGTYIHGLAGDKALQHQSMESLLASDIIAHLGDAWKAISTESGPLH